MMAHLKTIATLGVPIGTIALGLRFPVLVVGILMALTTFAAYMAIYSAYTTDE